MLASRTISRAGGCGAVGLERRAMRTRRGPLSPSPSDLGPRAGILRRPAPAPQPLRPRLRAHRSPRRLRVGPLPLGPARVRLPPARRGQQPVPPQVAPAAQQPQLRDLPAQVELLLRRGRAARRRLQAQVRQRPLERRLRPLLAAAPTPPAAAGRSSPESSWTPAPAAAAPRPRRAGAPRTPAPPAPGPAGTDRVKSRVSGIPSSIDLQSGFVVLY